MELEANRPEAQAVYNRPFDIQLSIRLPSSKQLWAPTSPTTCTTLFWPMAPYLTNAGGPCEHLTSCEQIKVNVLGWSDQQTRLGERQKPFIKSHQNSYRPFFHTRSSPLSCDVRAWIEISTKPVRFSWCFDKTSPVFNKTGPVRF
jgi:hypothetical protein